MDTAGWGLCSGQTQIQRIILDRFIDRLTLCFSIFHLPLWAWSAAWLPPIPTALHWTGKLHISTYVLCMGFALWIHIQKHVDCICTKNIYYLCANPKKCAVFWSYNLVGISTQNIRMHLYWPTQHFWQPLVSGILLDTVNFLKERHYHDSTKMQNDETSQDVHLTNS